MDSDSYVLLMGEYHVHLALSTEVTPPFNLENHEEPCGLSVFCSSEDNFNIFKVFCSILLQLKTKFYENMLLFQVCHFSRCIKIITGTTQAVLTTYSLST
jgi:hypothetical protein